jgi:hypothetical protein
LPYKHGVQEWKENMTNNLLVVVWICPSMHVSRRQYFLVLAGIVFFISVLTSPITFAVECSGDVVVENNEVVQSTDDHTCTGTSSVSVTNLTVRANGRQVLGAPAITIGPTTSVEAGGTLIASLFLLPGPEDRVCCGNEYDQRSPAIAYNRSHGEYLVVNHQALSTGGSIMGARVGLDGSPFQFFLLSTTSDYDCCLYPDVTYNWTNGEYLVVWQQYNNNQSKWEIYGLFVPWDGPTFPSQSTPFLIGQWGATHLKYPKVAWNSFRNEYMVVWHTENVVGNTQLGIGRRALKADGSFLNNAEYITQPNFPGFPDLAYNPAVDQYVVVWAQVGNHFIDIYGGKLSREGVLQGNIFPIGEAVNEQQFPTITTNEQDRYLVVWQDDRLIAGDWDIYGQFLDAGTNLVGNNFWLAVSTENETHPVVAVNGATGEYLIVYQRTSLSGESIWANYGNEIDGLLNWVEISAGEFGDNAYPAVAADMSSFYVVYEWKSWTPGSSSDLYGRKIKWSLP